MSRYIDADKLMKVLEEDIPITDNPVEVMVSAIAALEAQPTADVRENVKGTWKVYCDDKGVVEDCYCDQCGFNSVIGGYFCPNCGADMRGEA